LEGDDNGSAPPPPSPPAAATGREGEEEQGGEDEFGEMVGAPGKDDWAELGDGDEHEHEHGGEGEGWTVLEEEEEEDGLPAEAEVVRTHVQIFGPPPPPPAPPGGSSSSQPKAAADQPRREDYEQAFDLSSALGALQSMRDEIQGMTDEKARRRAAARVALGLVHGLGLKENEVGEVMRHG